MMKNLTEQQADELSISIGQQVAELLNLKLGKDGRLKTSWGSKSILGLGKCIERIVEEQTNLKQSDFN